MGKWDFIFKGGEQVDSRGVTHEAKTTEGMIDKAVESFNPEYHEPPVVLGHPKDNSPAFGYVEGLRKTVVNGVPYLQARYKDVAAEFKDWTNRKLYKKKSAAFYPDGGLRHVGYLGGTPPAVKGLPDFVFKEKEEGVSFEFTDSVSEWKVPLIGDLFQKLREWIIEKNGVDEADKVVRSWEIDDLKRKPVPAQDVAQTGFSEPSIITEGVSMTKEELEKAKEAARKEAEAEFAEKHKNLQTENDELKKEKAEADKKEIAGFCEGLKNEGKITPAMEKAGLVHFMEELDNTAVVEFAEGDAGKKTHLAFMKDLLSAMPKQVEFKEVGGGAKAGVDLDDAPAIARAAVEFQESENKAGRTVSMTEAVGYVTKGGNK